MYSKEESKQIKKEFWTRFGFYSQRKRVALGLNKKWISHQTGISCLSLKFDFDNKKAMVGIEINSNRIQENEKYYNRLLPLKSILNNKFRTHPVWNPKFQLSDGKMVMKIYHELGSVNIHDKSCWPNVFNFLYNNMLIYESFYEEYKDIIKDEEW